MVFLGDYGVWVAIITRDTMKVSRARIPEGPSILLQFAIEFQDTKLLHLQSKSNRI